MRGPRRFSQAISEGESISLVVAVGDADAARAAGGGGAEAVVVLGTLAGVRDATELPILWATPDGEAATAADAGADAWVLRVAGDEDDGRLERLHQECASRGLDCVVAVRDEDELRLALDRLDPEIFLLLAPDAPDGGAVEHVLSLLPDVPAGKLAIADLERVGPTDVDELERAGVDAVVVQAGDLEWLAGGPRG